MKTRYYLSTALVWPLLFAVPGLVSAGPFVDPLDQPALIDGLSLGGRMFGVSSGPDGMFAVGAGGRILTMKAREPSWTKISSPVSSDLTAIAFATPQRGFVVGHDSVVLRSDDGGTTWKRQFDARTLFPKLLEHYKKLSEIQGNDQEVIMQWVEELTARIDSEAPLPLFDVWFSDANNGYAVGAFNLLLVTTDGGDHWLPRMEFTDNHRGTHLYAVRDTPGPDGDVYIAGEIGTLMHLDRASGRFVTVTTPYEGTYFSLMVDGNALVVAGLRGNAYLSRDKGVNWRKLETGSLVSITAASATAQGRFALMAQNGSIIEFDAKGALLGESAPSLRRAVYAMHVAQDGTCVVGTDGGMRSVQLKRPGH